MLYASPLGHEPIDYRSEAEALGQVLGESGADVKLKIGAASAGSLTKLLALARSRRGLVLHLSAHATKHPEKGLGLVLEDPSGGAHVLWRQKLEEFLSGNGGLRHISLLFLSTCYSEELAQVFIEHGCQHVLATREKVHDTTARRFAQQFYYELAVNNNLLRAWEGAMQAMLIDPNSTTAQEAGLFTFYGQRGADRANLETLCGIDGGGAQQGLAASLPMRDFADVSSLIDLRLPARPENFVGRASLLHALARTFQGPKGRRVVVIHGPEGIGKSAFAVEFAHFATAPGRLFSCSPLLLRISSSDVSSMVVALEDQLEYLNSTLSRRKDYPNNALSRSDSVASSRSDFSGLSHDNHRSLSDDLLSTQVLARARITRLFQQLERNRWSTQLLVIIDDEAGHLKSSMDMRWLLGDLLDNTHHLHFLILARDPLYDPLGQTKIVNEPMNTLSATDACRLFLHRIHRRLDDRDLRAPGGGEGGEQRPCGHSGGYNSRSHHPHVDRAPSVAEKTAGQLNGHPLMRRLDGHPGRICAVAARVTPGGPSLFELADCQDLFDAAECPSPGARRKQGSPGPGVRRSSRSRTSSHDRPSARSCRTEPSIPERHDCVDLR